MKITLNNKEETFEKDELTVSEILELSNFSYKLLIVKLNGKYIKKEAYDKTVVHDNDDLMVLHLVTGG